jgi:hypothetical protein
MSPPLTFSFCAGSVGNWRIATIVAVAGESLPAAARLAVHSHTTDVRAATWRLRGVVSNTRYTTAAELEALDAVSPGLGRAEASCAALIPI